MQASMALIKMACGSVTAALALLMLFHVSMLGFVYYDTPAYGDLPWLLLRTLASLAMLFCSAFTFRSGILDLKDLFSKPPLTAAR